MIRIKIITVGSLKENYLKDAVNEYVKRLKGLCTIELVELKESKLPENPSANEISLALDCEGYKIISQIPQRSYKIALCVEGKMYSSEDMARRIESVCTHCSEISFIIGSSYGLSDNVKRSCDMMLSISPMTFPHHLMRVVLLEVVYRSLNIIKGTKYHK